MSRLTAQDYEILNYLQSKENYVSMRAVAQVMEIDSRSVRRSIERIKRYKLDVVIVSNNKGYKVARTDEEIKHANDMLKSRIKTSIEVLVANDPLGSERYLHSTIAEVVKTIRHQNEGQLDIDGNVTAYKQ